MILVQHLTQKLDTHTCRLWKECLSDERLPNFSNFIKFLNNRRQVLQNLDSVLSSVNKVNISDKSPYRKAIKPININRTAFHARIGNNICQLCKACLLYTSQEVQQLLTGSSRGIEASFSTPGSTST